MNPQNQQTHAALTIRNQQRNAFDSPTYQRNQAILAVVPDADDVTAKLMLKNVYDVMNIDEAFIRAAQNSAMDSAIGSLGVETINALKIALSASSRSSSLPPHRLASFITAFAAELTKLEQS